MIEYKLSASPSLETSVVYAKQLLLNFCQRANERWAGQMLLFCIYIYIYTIGFFFYYLSIWKDCIRRVEKASWCSSLVGVNILKICALAEPSNWQGFPTFWRGIKRRGGKRKGNEKKRKENTWCIWCVLYLYYSILFSLFSPFWQSLTFFLFGNFSPLQKPFGWCLTRGRAPPFCSALMEIADSIFPSSLRPFLLYIYIYWARITRGSSLVFVGRGNGSRRTEETCD